MEYPSSSFNRAQAQYDNSLPPNWDREPDYEDDYIPIFCLECKSTFVFAAGDLCDDCLKDVPSSPSVLQLRLALGL